MEEVKTDSYFDSELYHTRLMEIDRPSKHHNDFAINHKKIEEITAYKNSLEGGYRVGFFWEIPKYKIEKALKIMDEYQDGLIKLVNHQNLATARINNFIAPTTLSPI